MLTQFLKDAREKSYVPQKIVRYRQEVQIDPETKKKQTTIAVTFTDKDNDRMHYKYTLKEGEEPRTKVYALPAEEEYEFPSQKYLRF